SVDTLGTSAGEELPPLDATASGVSRGNAPMMAYQDAAPLLTSRRQLKAAASRAGRCCVSSGDSPWRRGTRVTLLLVGEDARALAPSASMAPNCSLYLWIASSGVPVLGMSGLTGVRAETFPSLPDARSSGPIVADLSWCEAQTAITLIRSPG